MARKPMVTRTITTTKVNVLCLDISTAEPYNKVITLPRTYKEERTLLKKVQEVIETDNLKAVHIVDKEEIETLYGMTEQDFIEKAIVLDPETRKPESEESESEKSPESVTETE